MVCCDISKDRYVGVGFDYGVLAEDKNVTILWRGRFSGCKMDDTNGAFNGGSGGK